MNTTHKLAPPSDPGAWQHALYAILVKKERRSGSRRTVESYSRMLQDFCRAEKTPEAITSPDVLSYAHGIGLSGRPPSATTVGARISCVSSFYRFLIRMGFGKSNPCDALERPKAT